MSEKKIDSGSTPRDWSPSSHADVEIGSVAYVEPSKNGDEALQFLKNNHNVGAFTAEEEKRLVRKIDWMIMPLMWSCYCLQYLDKTLGKLAPVTLGDAQLTCCSQLRCGHGPLR